ncbi:GspE/PulE family protein [Planctomycetaceae bacterium SH139]
MTRRLGDILIEQSLVTAEQLDEVFRTKPKSVLIGDWLLENDLLSPEQLGQALSCQFEVPFADVDPTNIDHQVMRLLPEDYARQHEAVAVGVQGRKLRLAMVAPDDIEAIAEAELMTGYEIQPEVALGENIRAAIGRAYDERTLARQTIIDMKMAELNNLREQGEESITMATLVDDETPVVRLVHAILTGAATAHASDIHLEPHKPEMRVRYRVDGQLQPVMTIPNHIEESVVSRIKVMAEMDTTETRRPQDGQLSVLDNGSKINYRVSNIPTVDGQKLVLRLLEEGSKVFELERLGMSDVNLASIKRALDRPFGMFVVTGPTGSGKSTTLYAALQYLNSEDRNIVTVEDPVEYQIVGINQVQSDNEFGMGFANALKYIMRQDPDVIMLGEIRDRETAATAVQAALTGHLMLSTLHTNDAVGAVQRLADLGIDSFKIAGSLLGSIAQRLLRRICEHCKQETEASPAMLETLDPHGLIPAGTVFYKGQGCRKCVGTGFAGRMPIFEIMTMNDVIVRAIEAGAAHSKLRELSIEQGMVELSRAGLQQVIAGNTTLEEVYFKTKS